MRLLSIDLYEETPNRGRHDLLKFRGTTVEFRYMRRMMSRLLGTCPIEYTLNPYNFLPRFVPNGNMSLKKIRELETQIRDARQEHLFLKEHFFILRVYHNGRIFDDPMVRDARDRLMLLKLAS